MTMYGLPPYRMHRVSRTDCVLYLPLWKRYGTRVWNSISGAQVTVTGATWGKTGRTFDATDDNIDCGDIVSPEVTDAITIEIWIKHIGAAASTFWIGQMQPAGAGYDWGLYFPTVTKVPTLYVTNSLDTDKNTACTTDVSTGDFFHIVGTYDGAVLTGYVNGVQEGTPTAQTGNIRNSSYNVVISKWNSRLMNHVMGEARVYKRALTAHEVYYNYQATKWRYLGAA